MTPLVFVTQSESKLVETERILGVRLEHYSVKIPEVQAVELEEVIEAKAKSAYRMVGGKPVMVEDTGLFIEALNGLPGALTRWFLERLGVNGICELMAPFANKAARAKTLVGIYDGSLRIFQGVIEGRIADRPRGEFEFGWDSLFIPEGTEATFAEMRPEEKDRISMRRRALELARAGAMIGGVPKTPKS
jgi:non-canonical purine NTP pyrophosphatase (RdgB/HAM1 family)